MLPTGQGSPHCLFVCRTILAGTTDKLAAVGCSASACACSAGPAACGLKTITKLLAQHARTKGQRTTREAVSWRETYAVPLRSSTLLWATRSGTRSKSTCIKRTACQHCAVRGIMPKAVLQASGSGLHGKPIECST